MRRYLKIFLSVFILIIISPMYGQTSLVCDNGGFELGYTSDYYFNSDAVFNVIYGCDVNTSTLYPIIPTGENIYLDGAMSSLVNNNTSLAGGFDPLLNGLPTPINIPRVNNGTYAMKLNDYLGRQSITSMSKEFVIYEDFISYSFSLIMHSPNSSPSNQPRFIVRVYDSSNTMVSQKCIEANPFNAIFTSVAYGSNSNEPLLYTGWRCDTISKGAAANGSRVRLEFIIADSMTPFEYFGIAYIDDICNVECPTECEDCINIDANEDVFAPNYDQQQAKTCIKAFNTVNDSAFASYHAGNEVVLYPGFESLYGSKGHYYIEECTGEYNLRQAMLQQNEQPLEESLEGLKVYPNPTNGELNILAGDIAINTVNLTSIEGKTIYVNQHSDNGNYKLDISSLSQGIYLLTIEKKNGEVVIQKIVKQ